MKPNSILRTIACLALACSSCSDGSRGGCAVALGNAPYRPLLEADDRDSAPTEQQKLWALATCAVLTECNGGRPEGRGLLLVRVRAEEIGRASGMCPAIGRANGL